MSFDFYLAYKELSDLDLAAIIRHTDNYQPQAVEAAIRVLKERGMNEEDINTLVRVTGRKEKKSVTETPASLMKTTPPDWAFPFFVLVALVMGYMWYTNLKNLISTYDSPVDDKRINALMLIIVVSVPVMTVLLFIRNRWGWGICFALASFAMISVILSMVISWEEVVRDRTLLPAASFSAVLNGGICFGLSRSDLRQSFGVRRRFAEFSLMAGILLTVLFLAGTEIR